MKIPKRHTERAKEFTIIIILILGLMVGAFVIASWMSDDLEAKNVEPNEPIEAQIAERDYRAYCSQMNNEVTYSEISEKELLENIHTVEPNEPSEIEIHCPCGLRYKVMGYDLCFSRSVTMLMDISEPNNAN